MTKIKIKELVNKCINEKRICRFYFIYAEEYYYYFPLYANDKLFLGLEEDDFITDGFSIRRFKDVKKTQYKNDLCEEIIKKERLLDTISIPYVDISTWESVFNSLKKLDKNIIIKKENLNSNESKYVIGRIELIYKKFAYVRYFDADGIWGDEPYRIPYIEITSITFESRYINTFSKYLPPLPNNFSK